MLILNGATDALKLVLSSASTAALPVAGSYRGLDASTYSAANFGAASNGTTPVTILAGDASFQLVVDFFSVLNPNAENEEVTITLAIAGTDRVLMRVTLAQYERLEYQEGKGFSVYASTGAQKLSLNQGANALAAGDSVAVLAADVTNNNAVANSIADVTGLSFAVVSGTRYWFEFFIRYTSAATTTGSRWAINGPAFSELTYDSDYTLTATTRTLNSGNTAYDLPAASSASSLTAGNMAWIAGWVKPSADGTVIARFASEVASSAIVAKAGSFVRSRAL